MKYRGEEVADAEDGEAIAEHQGSSEIAAQEILDAVVTSASETKHYVPRQGRLMSRESCSTLSSASSINSDSSDDDLFEPIFRKRIRRPIGSRRRRLPSSQESGSSQDAYPADTNDRKKPKLQDEVEEPVVRTWRDLRVPEEIMNRIRARADPKIEGLLAEQLARKIKKEQEEKEKQQKEEKESDEIDNKKEEEP